MSLHYPEIYLQMEKFNNIRIYFRMHVDTMRHSTRFAPIILVTHSRAPATRVSPVSSVPKVLLDWMILLVIYSLMQKCTNMGTDFLLKGSKN
jgi:hypothetical protein